MSYTDFETKKTFVKQLGRLISTMYPQIAALEYHQHEHDEVESLLGRLLEAGAERVAEEEHESDEQQQHPHGDDLHHSTAEVR